MAIKRNQEQQQGQQQDERELKGQEGGTAEAMQRQRRVNEDDPQQKREAKEQGKLTNDLAEPHTGEPRYFEGSILKIDKDGNEVMSDHLEEGDRLPREVAEKYKAPGVDPTADQ